MVTVAISSATAVVSSPQNENDALDVQEIGSNEKQYIILIIFLYYLENTDTNYGSKFLFYNKYSHNL